MIKRLGKAKKNKQGAILIVVVLILALAMIFIATAMMLTQATRNRLYENTMSSQARLTVTSAAEVFLEALQTQEITDKQLGDMLSETPTRHTNNDDKIKMVVPGVPGMSEDDENCTYLDLYYASPSDSSTVYADFTTVIGSEVENVRIILKEQSGSTHLGARFKNQIDIAGDVHKEQLRFERGVGMTSPKVRKAGVTDNTILLRASSFEESSSSVVYSDIVYAPGSYAKWGGNNVFYGSNIFLENAYMTTKDGGMQFKGDFYFLGTSNDVSFIVSSANLWKSGEANWGSNIKFYFDGRSIQDKDKDTLSHGDNDNYVKTLLDGHSCYFVGKGGTVQATNANGPYDVTNTSSTLPDTAAGNMAVYKQYNYNPSNENYDKFPTNIKKEVFNTIDLYGSTTVLSTAKTFDYDNYTVDGELLEAGKEIAAGTEIITYPLTTTYPAYRMLPKEGGGKVIDPERIINIGSLSTYDSDKDGIIDLNKGGAYYIESGTTVINKDSTNPMDGIPYVIAIDGSKTTVLYFGSGEFKMNLCCFAIYNASEGMKPVIIVLEDGAKITLADKQWGDDGYLKGMCTSGFLSVDRGKKSAKEIGDYIHNNSFTSEDTDWEQANGNKVSYSSYYDGEKRPNFYIYGTNNNEFSFGCKSIVEAYIGLYDSDGSNCGFKTSGDGAMCNIYGRLEGQRLANGTADSHLMPYCPAPADSSSNPDLRPAVTKYKVARVIYYPADM